MKLFSQYLKLHYKDILLFMLFAVIFAIVFWLYKLPLEAVLYSMVLCLVATFVLVALGYFRFAKRHELLQSIKNHVHIGIAELPPPRNLIEEDYTELLSTMNEYKSKIVSENEIKYTGMIDYYTMWVHQIKTPIAAMQLLLQEEESELNSELLEQLFRIEQYVGMVLQYLRMEEMSSDLVIRKYPLDEIVKQAVRKYAKSFIRKKIGLEFSDLNCDVLTDEKWLVFVVEQIISNSLKYSKEGKISIYMDPRRDKTLVIQDTGIGIQAEDLPRVFEKGFTGYNGRTNKKSTGIGLHLSKRILEKLSHTIMIESEVGYGTIVRIGLDMVDIIVE